MPWGLIVCACGYCGRGFEPKLHGPAPTYCSNACRQAAHRERNALGGRPQPHRRTTSERRERGRRELELRARRHSAGST